MNIGPEHVEAVTAAADKIHAAAVLLSANQPRPQSPVNTAGGATINVNMGGWGVAVAVCATLFCLLMVIDMRSDQRDSNRKIERSQDYNNMLWQRYPELRPENLKPNEEKKP